MCTWELIGTDPHPHPPRLISAAAEFIVEKTELSARTEAISEGLTVLAEYLWYKQNFLYSLMAKTLSSGS